MSEVRDVWQVSEEAPDYCEGISDLWHWSTNYEPGRNPFVVFLDLIGYSQEEYGEPMFQDDVSTVLGYVELGKLAKALTEYADRPTDTLEFVRELLEAESS